MPAIRYTGDVSWMEKNDPEFSVDNWGTDNATWLWSGAVTGLETFKNNLRRWQVLPGYSLMQLADWSTNWHRSFPEVTLRYVGLRRGTPPPAKAVDGIILAQAQLTINGTEASFTYRAARTTWDWYETVKPSVTARYTTVRRPTNIPASITDFSAGALTRQELIDILNVAINEGLEIKSIVTNYTVEDVIPNTLWHCTSDVEYRFP